MRITVECCLRARLRNACYGHPLARLAGAAKGHLVVRQLFVPETLGPSHAAGGAQGEAQREIVRVTVECCLQERVWNAYYGHLLTRLAGAAKGHCVTLQFCLWDHFKQAKPCCLWRQRISCAWATCVSERLVIMEYLG